jgi:hypothetical protein
MAIYLITERPKALLDAFNEKIQQTEAEGKITTWVKVGDYYTHKAADWSRKAFMKASTGTNRLIFNIIKPDGANISVPVYGYYHGHLIETFLNHFDTSFSSVSASPGCADGDLCSTAA